MSKCVICGSDRTELWYRGGPSRKKWRDGTEWEVLRCRDCDHRFIDPYPDWEDLLAYYTSDYPAYGAKHGVGRAFEEAVKAAKSRGEYRHVSIRPGMRVLDVGCGGGSFLAICQALGAEVQGVEPSADGAATCREAGVPVFHGDLSAFLDRVPGTFDLVTANHVVEHHPDPVRMIGEMRSILAPGGMIWIAVPNAGSFFARRLRDLWHSADLPIHLQHFTRSSVERMFDRADLRIEKIATESEDSLPSSMANLARSRFGIPGRVTKALFSGPLKKSGWLGRRIDDSGNGEAILVSARPSAA